MQENTIQAKTRPESIAATWGQAEYLILGILAALSVLLSYQASHLWERPHFQFFPIAWIAFAVLVYQRGGRVENAVGRWRILSGFAIGSVGLLVAVVAGKGFSPWLAHAAAILCITGWGLTRLGSVNAFGWLGWTALLWVTLPLPSQLDSLFINSLQSISSQSAGALLDLAGVMHLRQGNLIEIRTGKLFVDEACSGVDSLYSLLAITLLMMIWQSRPLIIGLATLAIVPLFTWLGNVIRLFTISFALDRYSIDLSHGVPHTILGLFTFALSALCLYASLQGFTLLFKRFPKNAVPSDKRGWYLLYNRIVCFPGEAPKIASEDAGYFDVGPRTKDAKSAAAVVVAPANRWRVLNLGAAIVCASATMLFTTYHLFASKEVGLDTSVPRIELSAVEKVFSATGLPEQLAGATRLGFQTQHRPRDDFFGQYSQIWAYRNRICDFQLSVDFPFRGFHPLWLCYTSTGNQLAGDPEKIAINGLSSPYMTSMKLIDEVGTPAYVWFAHFTADGTLIEPGNYKSPTPKVLLARLFGIFSTPEVTIDPIVYQYQMFVPAARELSAQEREELLAVYSQGLEYVVQQVKALNKP